MIGFSYFEALRLAAPETILAVAVLLVLAADSLVLRGTSLSCRLRVGAMIAAAGCAGAVAWLLAFAPQGSVDSLFVVNSPIRLVKAGVLVLALAALWLSVYVEFTEHAGEFIALILLGSLALLFLASAEHLLSVFVSLEFASLTLYLLAGFNGRDARSSEAALKYFLFGGISGAITLFGFSYLYGYAGVADLAGIGEAIRVRGMDSMLTAGLALSAVGFGFKVAAAPFQFWAPDVYQAAPLPGAAFIASASKLAGFFILTKFLLVAFGDPGGGLRVGTPVWALIAAASMVGGNLAALAQGSLRRLVAYSAVAQAGYMLIGVLAGTQEAFAAVIYYAVTYGFTALGVFAVIGLARPGGGADPLPDFAGLNRRAPVLAWSLMVFLLSLAGIPPLAGFFGKFYLFAAALKSDGGLLWLIIVAVAASAVSLYYYLQVLKQAFVEEPDAMVAEVRVGGSAVPVGARLLAGSLAGTVILLGCAPELLLRPILNLPAISP